MRCTRTRLSLFLALLAVGVVSSVAPPASDACTGVTLKAKDGAVVYGRSMEWGSSDLNSRLIVIPRGTAFVGSTPDGRRADIHPFVTDLSGKAIVLEWLQGALRIFDAPLGVITNAPTSFLGGSHA